jgi:hypothetical protein
MTPEEFRHPTTEQLAGINVFYGHGKPPVVIDSSAEKDGQAATSNNDFVNFKVSFQRPKPDDRAK